jgi:predicted dehydrogenase
MGSPLKLRVGIVGCGYQGGRLVEAMKLVDRLELGACADINLQAAIDLAGKAEKVKVFSSLGELLDRENVDVIMVATSHEALATLSLEAIQAGKHVLVEKPCGMNDTEMEQVEEAAVRAGICYLAGYSFRYIPSWYRVYELIQEGVVGEIQAVMGIFTYRPMNEGWSSRPETGGGPLLFIGSHLIDQVLWYLQDDPVEVYASVLYRHDTQADETSAFQVGFARGATAQLMVTQAASSFKNQMDIIGRSGSIQMRWTGFLDYEILVTSSTVEAYKQPTVLHIPIEGDPRNVKHYRQLNEFVDAIQCGTSPFVTLQDGRRVLKVIDAVFASDRLGEPVHIN